MPKIESLHDAVNKFRGQLDEFVRITNSFVSLHTGLQFIIHDRNGYFEDLIVSHMDEIPKEMRTIPVDDAVIIHNNENLSVTVSVYIKSEKPKVIDTTKPIPTDDVRQLIDAAMDRDDKEIYIYISKDATTITISPKRDELTTCKETLCENAHKVMAQEHFEKLIREFVFDNKKG